MCIRDRDHLLSKELDTVGCENGWINPTKTEEEVENCNVFYCWVIKEIKFNPSGADAVGGHTRSHPEHDG